jgi:hypothetical protein
VRSQSQFSDEAEDRWEMFFCPDWLQPFCVWLHVEGLANPIKDRLSEPRWLAQGRNWCNAGMEIIEQELERQLIDEDFGHRVKDAIVGAVTIGDEERRVYYNRRKQHLFYATARQHKKLLKHPETLRCYTIEEAQRIGVMSLCDSDDFIRMNDGRIPAQTHQAVYAELFGTGPADTDLVVEGPTAVAKKVRPRRTVLGHALPQQHAKTLTKPPSERGKRFIVDSGTWEADAVLGLTLPFTCGDAEHVRRSVYRNKRTNELYYKDIHGTKHAMKDPATHKPILDWRRAVDLGMFTRYNRPLFAKLNVNLPEPTMHALNAELFGTKQDNQLFGDAFNKDQQAVADDLRLCNMKHRTAKARLREKICPPGVQVALAEHDVLQAKVGAKEHYGQQKNLKWWEDYRLQEVEVHLKPEL